MIIAASFASGMLLGGVYLWHLKTTIRSVANAHLVPVRVVGRALGRLLAVGTTFYVIVRIGGALGVVAALVGFSTLRILVLQRLSQQALGKRGE